MDGSLKYGNLAKVAKLVLIILHSNAGEERVFNLIKIKYQQDRVLIRMELCHL